jgi:phytol kinase
MPVMEHWPPFWAGPEEFLRLGLVSAYFLALFGLTELWHRRAHPPVEWTRKITHFGAGIVVACFPWIFASWGPVLAASLGSGLGLELCRRQGWLNSVYGIERESHGDRYYPLAVLILFVTGYQRPVFYFIAIALLVVSDALAAILGKSYGRIPFSVETDRKSLEGSLAFFVSAFLLVQLPLLLGTDLDRTFCVVIALQCAFLVTCFEAISIRGLDNLAVPLGTYFLLTHMSATGTQWLLVQLGAEALILAAASLLHWRYRFVTFSGVIACHLFFYGAFSLGGPAWTLAPAFLVLMVVWQHSRQKLSKLKATERFQVLAVFWLSLVPAFLYFLGDVWDASVTLAPALKAARPAFPLYLGILVSQLSLVQLRLWRVRHPRASWGPLLGALLLWLGGAFAVMVPLSLWLELGSVTGPALAGAAALALVHATLCVPVFAQRRHPSEALALLRWQAALGLLACAVVLPFYGRFLGGLR